MAKAKANANGVYKSRKPTIVKLWHANCITMSLGTSAIAK